MLGGPEFVFDRRKGCWSSEITAEMRSGGLQLSAPLGCTASCGDRLAQGHALSGKATLVPD